MEAVADVVLAFVDANVLTLNEIFIYTFSLNITYFWAGMMLVIMVKEIHNYSFSDGYTY